MYKLIIRKNGRVMVELIFKQTELDKMVKYQLEYLTEGNDIIIKHI